MHLANAFSHFDKNSTQQAHIKNCLKKKRKQITMVIHKDHRFWVTTTFPVKIFSHILPLLNLLKDTKKSKSYSHSFQVQTCSCTHTMLTNIITLSHVLMVCSHWQQKLWCFLPEYFHFINTSEQFNAYVPKMYVSTNTQMHQSHTHKWISEWHGIWCLVHSVNVTLNHMAQNNGTYSASSK